MHMYILVPNDVVVYNLQGFIISQSFGVLKTRLPVPVIGRANTEDHRFEALLILSAQISDMLGTSGMGEMFWMLRDSM